MTHSTAILEIVSILPFPFYWKSIDGRFLGCSNVYALDRGLKGPGEIVGKTDKELFPESEVREYYERVEGNVLGEGKPLINQEESYLRVGKNPSIMLASRFPLFDAEGEPSGLLVFFTGISSNEKSEDTLSVDNARYRGLMEHAPSVILGTDLEGRIQFINKEITGYENEELRGRLIVEFFRSLDRDIMDEKIEEVKQTGEPVTQELRGVDETGPAWYNCRIAPLLLNEKITGLSIHLTDITEHKQVAEALLAYRDLLEEIVRDRTQELSTTNQQLLEEVYERKRTAEELRLHTEILENMAEGVCLTRSIDGVIVYTNKRFDSLFGYKPRELFGKHISLINSPAEGDSDEVLNLIIDGIMNYGHWSGEINHRRKDGTMLWCQVNVSHFEHAEYGNVWVSVHEDVSSRVKAEEELRHQAFHDSLTGLANRAFLKETLEHELAGAHRNKQLLAVIFLDLDRFKIINDSLGHSSGDWLLRNVARRLKECLRANDTLARQGGDEFIILLPDLKNFYGPQVVANKIIKAMETPFQYHSHELRISCSLGIAIFPQNGETVDVLMKNADTAMYNVKQSGRNGFAYYTEALNKKAMEKLEMEGRLHKALERNEFELHYQPRLNLKTGEVTGVEALIRWVHPELGPISPMEFIPLAEENGLIIPIGEWVMKTACEEYRSFQEIGHEKLVMAVNCSPRQFQMEDLVVFVENILKQSGMEGTNLEIEITESAIMKDADQAQETLLKLKELGTLASIDDFGTGYSSLAYLKRFPIDVLKIDKAFVCGVPENTDDVAIVSAIIALAHSLKLKVIAEGVESKEQLDYLRQMDCDEIQGYYFARPMPLEKALLFLKEHI